MINFYQILLVFLLTQLVGLSSLFAQTPDITWAKQAVGMNESNTKHGLSVAIDENGNTYATGYFQGVIAFDTITIASNGGYNFFIVKYNAAGHVQWA